MTVESFTNGELFALQEPLKQLSNVDVPARVGIKIARLIRVLIKEVEPINEVRNKLILKYGRKTETGQWTVDELCPEQATFTSEYKPFADMLTKVEFEKVTLPEDVKVDIKILVALEPFLEVEAMPPANPNGVAKQIPVATS